MAGLAAWRWTFLAETIPALLYGALAFTIPESPRYLVAAQRVWEARQVLSEVLDERHVDATVQRIRETLRREHPPSWRDLRKPTGGLYGIVWVGLGVAAFQQLVGITVIFYYGSVLWQAVGFGENASFGIAVATAFVNVVITLIAMALIDKVGRKPLLLTGSAGMALMLATLSLVFAHVPIIGGKPHLSGTSGVVALVAANVFVVAFAVSWGPGFGCCSAKYSQPHPCSGGGIGQRLPMADQLRGRVHLSGSASRPRIRLRLLCTVRNAVIGVRVAIRAGDQGRIPGRHARRAAARVNLQAASAPGVKTAVTLLAGT
ncbi:sugar (and other) transporter family protein [Mycobacterium xenopi 4042]|uniref:Sugar (And other) transporter family protein n=1 Tax=Mycobacterium xenopi 4042 TaxID=1299334 RepID=X8BE43_MYCXE|nr:sugar (and other) transporter family protein [Mycobacterium xenopi 4042]